MKMRAQKICNSCSDVVAVKHCILYHTVKNYVTVRGDDVTTYVNMEDNTTPYKLHYCGTCWGKIASRIAFQEFIERL